MCGKSTFRFADYFEIIDIACTRADGTLVPAAASNAASCAHMMMAGERLTLFPVVDASFRLHDEHPINYLFDQFAE